MADASDRAVRDRRVNWNLPFPWSGYLDPVHELKQCRRVVRTVQDARKVVKGTRKGGVMV